MLSLELALLSWDNTCSRNCSIHLHVCHCALFRARAFILRQYLFKELLMQFARSSLCSLWSLHSYPETIPIQGIAQSICAFFVVLFLELALLSWDNTYSRNCSFNLCIRRRAIFGAHALIMRQYLFKELLIQSASSSSCSLWSSRSYLETTCSRNCLFNLHICRRVLFGARALIMRQYLFKELLIQFVCSSSCCLWRLHFYPEAIPIQRISHSIYTFAFVLSLELARRNNFFFFWTQVLLSLPPKVRRV